jgi:hypothetical protein
MLLNLAAPYFPSPTTAAAREGWRDRHRMAFAGPWSARAQYDFIGLTNQTFTVTSPRRLAATE